ncbi:MAG: polysaccharide biosynthesis/export family protein [Terracidiphilus sp.]|nr:polysaccharide biosynthesis/export family protein [Terracidiphilus sp.]
MWTTLARLLRKPASSAAFVCAMTTAALAQQGAPAVTAGITDRGEQVQRQTPASNPYGLSSVPEGFEGLRLSPGYLLSMSIYGVPEMTTELRVDAKGFVTVPLIGAVHVDGDTLPQAQEAIAKALEAQEILKQPQVLLNVEQYAARNVSVLGEVHSPGKVQVLAAEPLGNVLALAGGETIAAGKDIEIQHVGANGETTTRHVEYAQGKDADVLRNTMVEPGDSVVVHRAGIIYVLGAVNRPGGYLMVDGGALSVVQAVSLAGGTTLQASTRWAVIVRRQGDSYVQFKVQLDKMQTGRATPVQLQWNDALYIPLSAWKSVLINGSTVISAATSASIYRAP